MIRFGRSRRTADFVQCVSFPRAGHHLWVKLLKQYYHGHQSRGPMIYYCGHYGACRSHPCRCREMKLRRFRRPRPEPRMILQKSHDRSMRFSRAAELERWGLPVDEPPLRVASDSRYLLQVRDPMMSTISDYRLSVGEPTTAEEWVQFAQVGVDYRKAFLEKWILGNPHLSSDAYLVLDYADVVRSPGDELARVATYLTPDLPVDQERIADVLAEYPVGAKWSRESFVFADTLPALEAEIAETWSRARRVITDVRARRMAAAGGRGG